jgi:hypothetical protein
MEEKKKIVIRSQSELSNTLNRLLVKGINLPPVRGNEKGHLITATDKFVLVEVVDHVNKNNGWWCYPSLKKIESKTYLSKSTVVLSLNKLTGYGLLQKQKGGEGKATRYKVDLDVLSAMTRVDITYIGDQEKHLPIDTLNDNHTDDEMLNHYNSMPDPCDLIDAPF